MSKQRFFQAVKAVLGTGSIAVLSSMGTREYNLYQERQPYGETRAQQTSRHQILKSCEVVSEFGPEDLGLTKFPESGYKNNPCENTHEGEYESHLEKCGKRCDLAREYFKYMKQEMKDKREHGEDEGKKDVDSRLFGPRFLEVPSELRRSYFIEGVYDNKGEIVDTISVDNYATIRFIALHASNRPNIVVDETRVETLLEKTPILDDITRL